MPRICESANLGRGNAVLSAIDELRIGPFLIREVGGHVTLTCSEETEARFRQELLEGPGRALGLLRQGYFTLHGSCIVVNGRAVSIVGSSGTGKSTLAAILAQRGATLVSDGMTPIHPETLLIAPGPPRTKLNDASLRLLGQEPSNFPLVHPESIKRYFPVRGVMERFGNAPRPSEKDVVATRAASDTSNEQLRLRLVLIVEDAEETEIVPLVGARTLIELIKNVYLVEYLPPEHSSVLMQGAAAIIQRGVQVRVLRRKKVPDQLVEIAEAIEREATALTHD